MKRFVWLSVLALTALAAVGGVAYSSSNPSAPAGQDRVYGGGKAGPPLDCFPESFCISQTRDFSLDVHATPAGQALIGDLSDSRPAGPIDRAEVTCVIVDGDKAAVGGLIRSGAAGLIGLPFIAYLVDNGPPSSPVDDLYSRPFILTPGETFPGEPADFPKTCPASADSFFGYLDVHGGDIRIVDALD
jgi:hypothetical protein